MRIVSKKDVRFIDGVMMIPTRQQFNIAIKAKILGTLQVEIYQILYDESQRQHLSTDTIWYDNSNATNQPCLENHVIAEIIRSTIFNGADYIGVLSWAFERKRAVRIDKLLPLVDGSVDVYAFDNMHKQPNVWTKSETWHKGIIRAAREAFFEMGRADVATTFDKVRTPNIYSNAFIARREVYQHYVHTWLIPFMNALERVQSAQTECKSYTSLKRKQGVTSEHLQRVTGYPYYTLMPFICERLFSTYLAFNPHLTIKHIA
jgi:hypothetical protein